MNILRWIALLPAIGIARWVTFYSVYYLNSLLLILITPFGAENVFIKGWATGLASVISTVIAILTAYKVAPIHKEKTAEVLIIIMMFLAGLQSYVYFSYEDSWNGYSSIISLLTILYLIFIQKDFLKASPKNEVAIK